jgi:acyl-CoA synthetase (AMP-forming)/AMP-acid ligase II
LIEELFRFAVRDRRDAVATSVGGATRSYAELDARSEALAAWLLQMVEPGRRLLLVAANGHEWVEAFLASQKAGVPLVPLHPRSGPREIAHAAAQSAPGALVHDGDGTQPWLAALPARLATLALGQDYEAVVGAAVPDVTHRHAPESMVVYTSGSTMQPRGVRLGATALLATTFVNQLLAPLGSDDRVLVCTPLAHRVALTRLIHALSVGATSVLVPRYSADRLGPTIAAERATVVGAVPTALRDLCARHAAGELAPLPLVRHLLVSGEPLTEPLRAALPRVFPNARLHAFYATTETGPVLVLEHDDALRRPSASGRPLPGVEIRLAADGEVLVRSSAPGWLIADGYLGRDDGDLLDADGWVHTGDVASADTEGFYTIVDRRKDMILSGGMNISSLEVEQVLAGCEGVAEVAVTAGPDARYGEQVVAWVVPEPARALTEQALTEHFVERAASFKKPRQVRFVDALPRTPAGKIDKRALRAQLASAAEVSRT